jgi:hypothetical protein
MAHRHALGSPLRAVHRGVARGDVRWARDRRTDSRCTTPSSLAIYDITGTIATPTRALRCRARSAPDELVDRPRHPGDDANRYTPHDFFPIRTIRTLWEPPDGYEPAPQSSAMRSRRAGGTRSVASLGYAPSYRRDGRGGRCRSTRAPVRWSSAISLARLRGGTGPRRLVAGQAKLTRFCSGSLHAVLRAVGVAVISLCCCRWFCRQRDSAARDRAQRAGDGSVADPLVM